MIFKYREQIYPEYLRHGNACQFIEPIALQFCSGRGVDVGCGKWPLKGAVPIELSDGADAMALPYKELDFVFASHSLEHLADPIAAIEHWKDSLRSGGVLFLYLPHPDMEYWRPENCRKHRHLFYPADIARALKTLGFDCVMHSERDLAWGFSCVGFKDFERIDR